MHSHSIRNTTATLSTHQPPTPPTHHPNFIMATSPSHSFGNTASPHLPHLTIPTAPPKRKSTDVLPISSPSVKRRKQSMLSSTSSNHPLRQTSFPPENGDQDLRYSPSPSVDNMSMVSGSTKAGRRISGKRKATHDDDASSLLSGTGRPLLSVSGRGGKQPSRGRSTGVGEEEEDEEDEEEAKEAVVDDSFEEYAKQMRIKQVAVRNALDPLNQDRFDAWRAQSFSNAMIKKLVNQTLSQSVPESVVFAIKTAAKLFAGDIIERARRVQEQWNKVSLYTQLGQLKVFPPSAPPSAPPSTCSDSEDSSSQSPTDPITPQQTAPASIESTASSPEEFSGMRKEAQCEAIYLKLDRENKGPLLPDHLIEAFRRYKDYDGSDKKLMNMSRWNRFTGAERFGSRNRKGRLFGGG